MPQRKETKIENAFTIDSIVTMLYHEWTASDQPNFTAVVYDFWQLLYLDKGEYHCRIGDKEIHLIAGQILFCEPGKSRATLSKPEASVAIVSFRCTSPKMTAIKNTALTLSDNQRTLLSHLLSLGTEKFRPVSDDSLYFGQEPERDTADYELQSIKNRLELLLIDLYQSHPSSQDTAPSAQNQLNYYEQQFLHIEHFLRQSLDKSLTVRQISEHTGLSPVTINRICRRYQSCGVIHFFLTLKIKEAKRLIRENDFTFTQISEMLGFSDFHYFSRLFKRITGVSPRQYAKSILKS